MINVKFDVLKYFVAAALILVSPALLHPIISGMEIARLAALAILILLALWGFYQRPEISLSWPSLFLVLLSFWLLLSVSWSADSFISLIVWFGFALLPLGYLVAALYPKIVKSALILTAFILGALTAGEIFYNYISLRRGMDVDELTSFANPNLAAALLSLCFFILLGCYVSSFSQKKAQGLVALLMALFLFGAVLLLGGRAVFFLLVIFCALFFLWGGKDIRRSGLIFGASMIIVFVLIGIANYSMPPITGGMARFSELAGGNVTSMAVRFSIWQSTWDIISNAPLLGQGFGTFYMFYAEQRQLLDQYSSGLMVHNDPLQLWAEAGLPAMILFYAFAVSMLFKAVCFFAAKEKAQENHAFVAALLCGLCALFAHAHLSFPFYVGVILLLSGLMLGTLSSLTKANDEKTIVKISLQSKQERQIALFVLVMLGAFVIYAAQAVLLSHAMTKAARKMAIGGNIEQYAALVNHAHEKGHGWNAESYVLAANVSIGILQDNPSLSTAERAENVRRAESFLDDALALSPRKISAYMARGALAEIQNDSLAALSSYKTALEINPMHIPARTALAKTYIEGGDIKMALKVLEDGLDWKISYHPRDEYFNMLKTLAVMEKRPDLFEKVEWQALKN